MRVGLFSVAALEAYDRYTIRVQPRSGTALEYDTSEREVIEVVLDLGMIRCEAP